ncbi:hypothetical protein PRIPAC_72285 [Pristionchus pacificus]|nr:hypothetical protein PRIPAC_72285 [Pristionchus pacificus]
MPVISICDFPIRPVNRRSVGMLTTTNFSSVDGVVDDRFTSLLVYGYDLTEALDEALNVAVAEVLTEFGKAPMRAQEKERKIAELRREDEASAACHYSRECTICFTASPSSRAVLTACGHVFCMTCVLKMEFRGRLDCPYCRKASGYVKIHEEKEEIENEDDENEEEVKEEESEEEEKTMLSCTSKRNQYFSALFVHFCLDFNRKYMRI